MFRTSIAGRTTRALATGALILSLGATTFVGSANAAPLANTQACSAAAQARNDAVLALHDAWKASVADLKSLLTDANKGHEELHDALLSAWHDLKSVAMQAREDIHDVGLGVACHHDEDDTNVTPAQGVATTTTDTSALDAKFKAIVDEAIKDMQAVVDGARKAVADLTAATSTTNGTNVVKDEESTKANEDKDKEEKDDDDKDNSSEKSKATSAHLMKATELATLKSKHNRHHSERERD
jgi:hypothetical protein